MPKVVITKNSHLWCSKREALWGTDSFSFLFPVFSAVLEFISRFLFHKWAFGLIFLKTSLCPISFYFETTGIVERVRMTKVIAIEITLLEREAMCVPTLSYLYESYLWVLEYEKKPYEWKKFFKSWGIFHAVFEHWSPCSARIDSKERFDWFRCFFMASTLDCLHYIILFISWLFSRGSITKRLRGQTMSNVGGSKGLRRSKRHQRGAAFKFFVCWKRRICLCFSRWSGWCCCKRICLCFSSKECQR